MSERLHEWLDQYTEVSNKQQEYLGRIHDLRRSLQNKDENVIIDAIDKMRTVPKHKHRRKYPLYALTKMEEATVNQGPDPFPSRPCLFHADEKKPALHAKMMPHSTPRKLAPIIKRVKTNKLGKIPASPHPSGASTGSGAQEAHRADMTKMRTEYEPFEALARRNRLNLTQFFNSTLSHRRSMKRTPMNVSKVSIINETQDDIETHKDFITDFASKKQMINTHKTESKSDR